MKPKRPVVLDPIPSNNDRENLLKLNSLHEKPENSSSTNNLLKEIRKGYLESFEHAEKRKQYIARQEFAKKFSDGTSTVKNILKRKKDVEEKILRVKEDNRRLKTLLASKQYNQTRDEMNSPCSELPEYVDDEDESEIGDINESVFPSTYYMKSWQTGDSLDVDKLQEKCDELQGNLNRMRSAVRNRYGEKEKYAVLKEKLLREERSHEKVVAYNKQLNDVFEEQKKLIQILKDELGEQYPDEKPSTKRHLSEPLLPMLEEKKFESDEPKDHQLVSSCIIYVNRFYEEFQKCNYKLAAQLAANSPRGILRSYTTFLQFKNATTDPSSKSSPAFLYCEALIKTSFFGGDVGENLSFEIVQCAVLQDDIDLVKHWLCNVILTWSKDIADLLVSTCTCDSQCVCGWTLLALQVYTKLKLYSGVVTCHMKLNNFKHVMKYMKDHDFSNWQFKDMVSDHPHFQLSYLLSDVCIDKPYITLAGMVGTFLNKEMYENIIDLLTRVYTEGLHGESLLNCLLKETVYDEMGEEGWGRVLDVCLSADKCELAEELYACLVIRNCLENASIFCLRDYIS